MSNVQSKRARPSRENKCSQRYHGVQKCRITIDYEQQDRETLQNSLWYNQLTGLLTERKGKIIESSVRRAYGVGASALSEAPSIRIVEVDVFTDSETETVINETTA